MTQFFLCDMQARLRIGTFFLKFSFRRIDFVLHMSKNAEHELELAKFWDIFRKVRDEIPLSKKDWGTCYTITKQTGLTNHMLSRLAKEKLIRTKTSGKHKQFAIPDVSLIKKILDYFKDAKQIEVVKEIDISGRKKYLVFDFHANRQQKSLVRNQIELFVKIYYEFMNSFFDCRFKPTTDPKELLKIKRELQKIRRNKEKKTNTEEESTEKK